MDNEQNKRLHLALGRHVCEIFVQGQCTKCHTHSWPNGVPIPAYDTDLNLCAEAEKEVIEKVGRPLWFKKLCIIVCPPNEYMDYLPSQVATASAADRVTAMIEVLGEVG